MHPPPLAPPSASPDGYLQMWEACSGMMLRGASALRKKLGLTETMFRRVAPMAAANTRSYFFYRVLDEVQKAAISLIHWKEFMADSGAKLTEAPDAEQILRVVLEETDDAQSLRCRKLIEVLVELVMFSSTDSEPYYRDYFIIRELIDHVACQLDRDEFFGFTNRNTDSSIVDFLIQIRRNEPNIDTGLRWYLSSPQATKDAWTSKPPKLNSFRSKYKTALGLFRPLEFVSAGKSYTHAYAFSRSIHFSPQETSWAFSRADLRIGGDRCVLLSLAILTRCAEMLQATDDPAIQQIASVIATSEENQQLIRSASEQIASVGDFIGMQRDIGRVTAFSKSKYGFYSYEMEYLGRPPLPEVPRDWFAGFEIRLLGKRSELLDRLGAELGAEVTAAAIDHRLDAVMLEMWTAHLQVIAGLRAQINSED